MTLDRDDRLALLVLAGALTLVLGLALIWLPLAVVTLGVGLMVLAWRVARG